MNKVLLNMVILAICTTVLATDSQDIEVSAMPNSFVNGELADADQVNANFEYLRNNIEIIKTILAEQEAAKTAITRFAGTYVIGIMDVAVEACGTGNENLKISGNGISDGSGTGVSNGTEMNISQTVTYSDIGQYQNEGSVFNNFPNDPEAFTINISSTGAITGPSGLTGQMSPDGNSFVGFFGESPSAEVEEPGCTSAYSGILTGIKLPE